MILIFSNLKTNLRWLSFKADENGRVKISSIGENFLHKSNENTCKAVKINFFTTLEINQNFQQSWDYYSKKKGLILVKKKKKTTLESFSYLCSSFLDLQFCCSPENQQMIITVETISLAATERTDQDRNLFKTRRTTLNSVFIRLGSELSQGASLPHKRNLLKTIIDNHLTLSVWWPQSFRAIIICRSFHWRRKF